MQNQYNYTMPIGKITITSFEDKITGVQFGEAKEIYNYEENAVIKEAARQLKEYFAGKRKMFDLPLSLEGTKFQVAVWRALQDIPYGETKSYKEIANSIGNAKACRAVGMANNRNKIAIIIPCHRVIGTNGALIGYAGGLDVKEQLLALEKRERNYRDSL